MQVSRVSAGVGHTTSPYRSTGRHEDLAPQSRPGLGYLTDEVESRQGFTTRPVSPTFQTTLTDEGSLRKDEGALAESPYHLRRVTSSEVLGQGVGRPGPPVGGRHGPQAVARRRRRPVGPTHLEVGGPGLPGSTHGASSRWARVPSGDDPSARWARVPSGTAGATGTRRKGQTKTTLFPGSK